MFLKWANITYMEKKIFLISYKSLRITLFVISALGKDQMLLSPIIVEEMLKLNLGYDKWTQMKLLNTVLN